MSNLVDHAKRELDILASKGGHDEELNQIIIECIEKFAEYDHSGGSAAWAIPVLNDLLQFKNLSPLTDNPEEWMQVHDGGLLYRGHTVWQSRRNPEAFSHDGGVTYYLLSEGGSQQNPWPKHKTKRYIKEKSND
jgi:hypothetical protein